MNNIVKRQHYVWRRYLRAWSENDSIWAYLKESNKIIKSNLMGVAQERYFYELIDFTDAEENFLKRYIDNFSPEAVKELNFDFLRLFTSTGKLKKSLEQTNNSLVDKEKISNDILELEKNIMEIAHGKIESLGDKLLDYRTLEELKTIMEDDYYFDAIMFLCFQYFRTKNMKNYGLKSFEGGPFEDIAKKSWNILCYITATTLAKNLSLDQNIKFIFYKNSSSNHFLTSDQPVFNLLNDKLNQNGKVSKLEFYYPISPKHALLLHFRTDQDDKFVAKNANDTLITYFNKKVFENSDFYVFADTKEQLERLKTTVYYNS